MKIEIREADRRDLENVLSFAFEKRPLSGKKMTDKFDEVLLQTGHKLLLCFANGELCGMLGVSVIDGMGEKFPVAVFCGGKLKKEFEGEYLSSMLISKGEEIARAQGCKKIIY